MSRNNTGKLIVRLFVFVVSLVLIGSEMVVSAQNSNSSTTTQEDSSVQNDNASGTNMNRGGRRRRGRRRSAAAMPPNACMPAETTTTETPVVMPVRTGRCDPMTQEQTDLSGTYTGRVGYTDVVMAGDATLTINGNNFTLTNGQMTAEGRIVAVTTCNYTAVTMRFGKDTTTGAVMNPPPPLPTVSLRAQRTGGGLSLDTVPGESHQFSFHTTGASGGGMSGGMPRVRRGGRRGGNKNGSPNPVGIKPPTAM